MRDRARDARLARERRLQRKALCQCSQCGAPLASLNHARCPKCLEKGRAAALKYYHKDPSARRASHAAWRHRNKGSEAASHAAWSNKNRGACQNHCHRRRARKLANTIVQFNQTQLAARLSMYAGCAYCGTNENLTVDHVKPLSKGGAHALCNLVPACGSCNSKKHARWAGVAKWAEGRV